MDAQRTPSCVKGVLSLTQVPLRKPVFVLGVMRSGTTFLHGLLAQDPAFRPPLLYELLNPVPPETGAGTKDDPRIAAAERVPGLFQVIDPDFPSKHEIGATLPHECYHLFGSVGLIDKVAQLFCFNITMYEKWWKKSLKREYMVEFYQDYKKALQMMTSKDEDVGHRRLLMKDHLHSLFSESLLEVFPDASFINPVRNPVDIVSSWCSVVDSLLPMYFNPGVITKFEIGRRVLEDIAYYTSTFLKYRKSCDQSGRQIRVIDVHQVDLVRDPITKVKEIYSYLGMELNSDVANKMAKYIAERKKSRKLQRHQHCCTDYGLTEKEILDKFQDYISYYKISV
ncbi:uncharacterized protein LOC106169895 isoform X2 [Lingula anatina]|uniref:Uncharacterized protein LOC106169895 isoform X2 n=1 Tax=Lingula anatina TaxID=7574 RepID=A0A1S3J400_LINAN|nr:uncharacterized protein LOC106169895 isoform X2 [Lingula anatina]XP_013404994.1 uncharacterized protein LOC106169895 isoform X2 [Lingula anatina]|eukprot:XP_013404993.1 uncharacterized protein LOC106169895 isoform X2 [Lingula anatina]